MRILCIRIRNTDQYRIGNSLSVRRCFFYLFTQFLGCLPFDSRNKLPEESLRKSFLFRKVFSWRQAENIYLIFILQQYLVYGTGINSTGTIPYCIS
jgi:hypothetical protein